MAIEDRKLTAGTKLWARYKGEVHTAEVVEVEGAIRYRLADGREFKSPSAAATAITQKAANGWAFWTVGEPGDQTGPTRATRATRAQTGGGVNAVPKPEGKRRRSRTTATEPPKDENSGSLPIIQQTDDSYECGECGATFPSTDEAAAHLAEEHPA